MKIIKNKWKVVLAVITYIYTRDKRILYLLAGLSFTHFVNVAYVLLCNAKGVYQIPRFDGVLMFISAVNVIFLACMAKVGLDIYIKRKYLILDTNFVEKREKQRGILNRKDFLLLGILTLIYSVIAFYNLGSFRAPQTFWKPARMGESFYVDFGETKNIERVYYFGGIGKGKYEVDFSEDARIWENITNIYHEDSKIYIWNILKKSFRARYVKLTVTEAGARLNELVFFEKNSRKPLEVKSIIITDTDPTTAGNPGKLFDEQNTVTYEPSFMNGMYFDEIYHARTAYEHLYQIEPYESTHPPLGKIFIAIGIALFGMTPLGWRVVGTLFGIGMIPLMYVFAKELFNKTEYAFFAAFLMAFDFMHFTQTRIATIDVYGVFFIILMYYFMYRYYYMNCQELFLYITNNNENSLSSGFTGFTPHSPLFTPHYFHMNFYSIEFRRTLIPLGLSGLSFGLGIASKWICLYGGVGLALIFFTTLYKRYKEYSYAKRRLRDASVKAGKPAVERLRYVVRIFPSYSRNTILWCMLFFIVIPFIIYFLSYIPFMIVPGPGHGPMDVVTYQIHMYNYHKTLKASHPFSSPWWQWPLIIRPVWYYGGQEHLGADKVSSIVAMGNPAIWWTGIPAVFAAAVMSMKNRDSRMYIVLVGLASQYIPWVLVPRLTFMYHFFASVPFVILCIAYVIMRIKERYPHYGYIIYGYMTVVLGVFVMFYPVLSGTVVDKAYVTRFLRWLPSWIFY